MAKIAHSFAVKPSRVVFQVDGVRFSAASCANVAIDGTLESGNIVFRRPPNASAAVKASKLMQGLTYEAVTGGTAGNSITVAYTNTVLAGAESASVTGSAITVEIQSGVSTAAQVRAAILASVSVSALVTATLAGAGTVVQTTQAATALTGGIAQSALESYDLTDIVAIKRLRTKKYLIKVRS